MSLETEIDTQVAAFLGYLHHAGFLTRRLRADNAPEFAIGATFRRDGRKIRVQGNSLTVTAWEVGRFDETAVHIGRFGASAADGAK